jgi:hypothetical protein
LFLDIKKRKKVFATVTQHSEKFPPTENKPPAKRKKKAGIQKRKV